MTFAGPFRQHFHASADDRDSKILEFDANQTVGATGLLGSQVANITTTNSLIVADPNTQTNTELTVSVWVYPVMDNESFENDGTSGSGHSPHTIFAQYDEDAEDFNIRLQITGNYSTSKGKVNFRVRDRVINHTVETINYNQWNHILISMESAQNSNTTYNDKIHLVVNGTRYTKTSTTNTLTGVSVNGSGDQLITSDTDFNFVMGASPSDPPTYSTGNFFYDGAIYQLFVDNVYRDMATYSNIQVFNQTAKRNNAALPNQSPLVLITDFKDFNSGTTTPGTIIHRNRVSTSTRSKP